MSDEDWVKAAMTDDSVVVELLVRLHHDTPPKRDSHLAVPLEWSVRQRRSKPILHNANKNKKPTPRASPATPLSWSGASSVSGGSAAATTADGVEDSSLPHLKRPDGTRSKVTATCETTTNKRTRKKKSLAELKEEETLLVKERRHLKRELATLRVVVEKQRATNESLKRLKLDLESQPAVESATTVAPIEAVLPGQTEEKDSPSNPIPPISPPEVRTDDAPIEAVLPGQTEEKDSPSDPIPPISPPEVRTDDQENQEPNIASELQPNQSELPDLNLPFDDNFNS